MSYFFVVLFHEALSRGMCNNVLRSKDNTKPIQTMYDYCKKHIYYNAGIFVGHVYAILMLHLYRACGSIDRVLVSDWDELGKPSFLCL